MSATCWSQTSLLLSQSQCNHQQLRKRKWLPSGQIRMCNWSYSNTGFLPELLYKHSVIIPYAYTTLWMSISARFSLSSVKLNRKSGMPTDIQIASLMRGKTLLGLLGIKYDSLEKMKGWHILNYGKFHNQNVSKDESRCINVTTISQLLNLKDNGTFPEVRQRFVCLF